MRLIVTVNGQKFRVPCGVEGRQDIAWLASDVARRYERYNKLPAESVQIDELRTSDGAILDPQDDILDVVSDMEAITGVLGRLAVGMEQEQSKGSPLAGGKASSPLAAAKSPLRSAANPDGPSPSKTEIATGGGGGARARGGEKFMEEEEVHPRIRVAVGSETLDAWAREELSMKSVDGHKDGTTCVHFNATKHLAVTGGRDKLVKVWDTAAESCLSELEGHTSNVRSVDTANNVIVSGGEATVRIWDMHEVAILALLIPVLFVAALALSLILMPFIAARLTYKAARARW